MPERDLEAAATAAVLAAGRVVRVAFRDGEATYLVPLGYAWLDGALVGVTGAGRKTGLGSRSPRVAFQVDSSAATGVYAWRSVTGEGHWEIVADPAVRAAALAALAPQVGAAPEWWRTALEPRIDAGEVRVWRITPLWATGRAFGPPGES